MPEHQHLHVAAQLGRTTTGDTHDSCSAPSGTLSASDYLWLCSQSLHRLCPALNEAIIRPPSALQLLYPSRALRSRSDPSADDTPSEPRSILKSTSSISTRATAASCGFPFALPARRPRPSSSIFPEAYLTEPERRFPVFYLHDGQNLFDGRTSYIAGHTWRANLTADRLESAGLMEPTILVGVDNTGTRRMDEYTSTRDRRLGGGEGQLYGRLVVEELKPLLDANLRTLPDAANTALGGSSLGGLISLALGLEYPQTFGKLAVLSPSVWWDARSILTAVHYASLVPPPRLWLDMGTAEGLRHLRDCDLLYKRLLSRGWRDELDLRYLRVPNAFHTEDAWADRFDQVLQFLFPAHGGAPHLAS